MRVHVRVCVCARVASNARDGQRDDDAIVQAGKKGRQGSECQGWRGEGELEFPLLYAVDFAFERVAGSTTSPRPTTVCRLSGADLPGGCERDLFRGFRRFIGGLTKQQTGCLDIFLVSFFFFCFFPSPRLLYFFSCFDNVRTATERSKSSLQEKEQEDSCKNPIASVARVYFTQARWYFLLCNFFSFETRREKEIKTTPSANNYRN